MARFLASEEFEHLMLKAPPAFIEVNLAQIGIRPGTYNVQRDGDFIPHQDASTLGALLEFLSFGVSQVSTDETFEVPACNLVKCTRADGSIVSYDLYRDNRFA